MSDAAIDAERPDVLVLSEEWRLDDRPARHPAGRQRPQALQLVGDEARNVPGRFVDYGQVPLDPDALRAMVAEIVRDELRGSLGTRLTGAVRKLVRSEMARTARGR